MAQLTTLGKEMPKSRRIWERAPKRVGSSRSQNVQMAQEGWAARAVGQAARREGSRVQRAGAAPRAPSQRPHSPHPPGRATVPRSHLDVSNPTFFSSLILRQTLPQRGKL